MCHIIDMITLRVAECTMYVLCVYLPIDFNSCSITSEVNSCMK